MIRNLVFDLGNVLVHFDGLTFLQACCSQNPMAIGKNTGESREGRKIDPARILFDFYFPDLWNRYDQGLLQEQDLIGLGAAAFPEYKPIIQNFITRWYEQVLPYKENTALLAELKEQGYNIYILSNIPQITHEFLKKQAWMQSIDGGVYSWQEKRIKPDPAIYQILLDRYALKPEECLFMDDKKENIQQAQKAGFQTLQIKNPQDLKSQLESIIK